MFFYRKFIPKHVLVGREDAMGDVIMALPVCGLIKKHYPDCKITFLGRTYTESIARTSVHVDEFMNYNHSWQDRSSEEVVSMLKEKNIDTVIHLLHAKHVLKECKNAGIKNRVGATNKMVYWRYCNRLVPFSKKKSRLSEAQLNLKFLKALNIYEKLERNEIYPFYGFSRIPSLDIDKKQLLDVQKFNLVIHPLSNKNAKEWGLHNFTSLISSIDLNRYKIFITGSPEEKETLKDWMQQQGNKVTDLTGALNTDQLIAFIAAADGLIASSTGPVHIAAATGINTLGLYDSKWSKRGQRWGPIGKKASYLQCTDRDMDTITPAMVSEKINEWAK